MMPTTTTASHAQPRCVRAGVLRPHVLHQPHGEDAEPVADRACRAADQSLEQRAARQQRRRQRQPQEHQREDGPGERVVPLPPGRLLLRWLRLRWCFFRRLRGVCHEGRLACVKFGGRFSLKAFMPSVWSAVANAEWNSLRS